MHDYRNPLRATDRNLRCKKDAGLAQYIGADTSAMSKMRTGRISLSATLVVRISEETGWPTKCIKAIDAQEAPQ
ncbi:hypothetical protein [Herbaspirillum frisingense]|uniref:XRE family transcriptional regulator n=1 Tax=Herbaspirillum frisingense TaxID=92645 RepID=A0ABU1PIS0_9BURK|nr:hypothetical protein [Herbaspirillum frisingense]MDR6585660.1 hypothetical protein [Herbaspirillum frisingense]